MLERPSGRRLKVLFCFLFLVGLVLGAGVTYAVVPRFSFTTIIEEGTTLSDYTYIVFKNGVTYCLKNGTTGAITSTSTNASYLIKIASEGLSVGRTWKEKIVLKGDITLDLYDDSGVRMAIRLYSYTILEIQGKIKLKDSANTQVGIDNAIVFVWSNQHDIEVTGGEIDGNKANNNLATNFVYGIRVLDSHDVIVQGVYVHDTSETGIAFEGSVSIGTRKAWAISNHVKDGTEDGIGNQYTCADIFYIGNFVEGCRTPGQGIFVEGGENIVVSGNTLFNNTNGIYVTRGTSSARESVSISGNHAYNNSYIGILLGQYVTNTIVNGNTVFFNAAGGILLDDYAHTNTISNNIVYNNDNTDVAHSGITLDNYAKYNIISGNQAFDNQTSTKQDWGIYENVGCDSNIYSNNNAWKNQIGGIFITTISTSSKSRITATYNSTVWIASWGTG